MTLTRLVLLHLLAIAPLATIAQDQSAESVINSPANARYDLGAVLAKRDGKGLTVMAVTPGGAAQRMQLREGDRLLAVNGTALDTPTPSDTLRQALASGGGAVRVEVARGGRTFAVDGRVEASDAVLPGAMSSRACGYVTNAGPTPTLSEKIFGAQITKIAGSSTPLFAVNRHRLDAGRQVLVVAEGIPASRFNSIQLIQRQRMRRQLDARAYKVLIVDVAPGMKYHVGAQLLPDRLDRQSILDNEYWKPVVWKQVPERCP